MDVFDPAGNKAPRPDVSVVIPVYKNSATLVALHRRLVAALAPAGLSFELLFVDDGCPEGSSQVIQSLADEDRRVRGIILAHNIGQHRAVLYALRYANGSAAVIMDADLQDPPEEIPRLWAPLGQGYEAVFADRKGAFQDEGRRLTSRLFKGLIHLLTGVPPTAGMYIVLSRRILGSLEAMNQSRPYLVGMIGLAGLPMTSVPVYRALRPVGRSAYSALHRLRMGLAALATTLTLKFGWHRTWPGHLQDRPIVVGRYIGQGFETGSAPAALTD